MKSSRLVHSLVVAAATFLCSTPALADPAAASRYYEDALRRYDDGDAAGAIVQLNNALREDGNMLAGRLLLARAYLRSGELGAAEVAFAEAQRLGVATAEVVVPLAQILLMRGKAEDVLRIAASNDLPVAVRVELLVLRGKAYAMLGRTTDARESFAQARALDPASAVPLVAEVPVLIAMGEGVLARELAEEAVRLGPKDAGAYNARASVAHAAGELDAALADYSRAEELDPGLFDASIARAGILVDLGRAPEARTVLKRFEQGPTEPRAYYLLALLAEREGDPARAARLLADAATLVDALPAEWLASREQLLMVGGLAHHATRQNEKARGYLETLVARYPNNLGGRRLLAAVLYELGDAARSAELLEHVLRLAPDDAQALFLLGRIQLSWRRYARASELLEQAARQGAGGALAALGFSRLGRGDEARGMADLSASFERSPEDLVVASALANLLARRGKAQEAVAVAERASRALAGNPVALNLLGGMRQAAGDLAGARLEFEEALRRDPGFAPARLNLARVDVAQGRFDAARATYAEMLRKNRRDAVAMHESALLEQRAGNLPEAQRWLEKAVAERPESLDFGLALVRLHAVAGARASALDVAKATSARHPGNGAALAALAEAQIEAGEERAARQTLAEMTRLADFDARRLLHVGALQMRAGNPVGAAYAARKILQASPGHEAAMVLEADAMAADPEVEPRALEATVAALRAAHPSSADALRLSGDLALRAKRHAEAERFYVEAHARAPSQALLARIAMLAVSRGAPQAAMPQLERWLSERGEDATVREMLAELHMKAGGMTAAAEQYERIIGAGEASARVYNNLANIRLALGKGDALQAAEKAYALAPEDARVLDTLGWVLAQAGRLDEALRHLRDARLRAPENGGIRWHLAEVLAKQGRSREARAELEGALQGQPSGEWVEAARGLLGRLP
jgi:putative PEP-CTERM system TPR-repeat lipoprotein